MQSWRNVTVTEHRTPPYQAPYRGEFSPLKNPGFAPRPRYEARRRRR
jgi:hypothetical protein